MSERPIIHSSDSSTPGRYSKDGNNWNVDGQVVDSYTERLAASQKTLPANDPADGRVNWLGSSFSGADVKILVHMYEDTGELGYENALSEQYADACGIISILDKALGMDLAAALSPKRLNAPVTRNTIQAIMDTTFDTVEDREVINYFYGMFVKALYTVGVDYESKISALRAALQEQKSVFTALRDSLTDQMEKVADIRYDQYSTFTLATAQTFSIQTHREKHAIRALGHSNVKGYTRGQRTIAGSIIFTMFNEHALASLIRKMGGAINKFDPSPSKQNDISSLLIDQLPPIDLTIVFANEYGSLSRGGVYGVEFMNSGITLSIEDLLTEEVVNFVARDVDPVVSVGRVGIDKTQRGMHFNSEGQPATGSDLLFASKTKYDEYLQRLGVRRKLRNR